MTIEEILKGVEENPDFKEKLLDSWQEDAANTLRGKGFAVRSKDDDEKEFGNRISGRVSEIASKVDEDIDGAFGFLGIKKEGNKKYYERIKEAGALAQSKISEAQKEIELLKQGKGSEVDQAKLKTLEAEVVRLQNTLTEKENEFAGKELNGRVSVALEKAFDSLQMTIPAHVAESQKGDYIANRKAQITTMLQAGYKPAIVDGELIFKNASGEVEMSGTKTATAADVIKKIDPFAFAAVASKGGTGSQGGKADGNVYMGMKDKSDLDKGAKAKGYTMGSPDYDKFVTEGKKALGIS